MTEVVHILDEKQRALVLESGRVLVESNVTLRNVSKLIAWHGGFIEHLADQGSWGVLGFTNQHEFRIAKGFSRSNWYRLVAVGARFQKLDRDSYLAMSTENAERLGLEKENVRYDSENVRAAADMKASDFADYLVTKIAHAEGKPKQEKWAEMSWKMRDAQKKVIQEGLKGWMAELELTDEVYALELLVAEYRDRPTFVGFVLEEVPKLTEAIKTTDDATELKLLMVSHIQRMGDIMNHCVGEEAVAS
jgi:hypothetical protein